MVNITFACNEGAAQTVVVLSIMPRSGGGPGTADCKIAVEPALEFAHRSGWGVCVSWKQKTSHWALSGDLSVRFIRFVFTEESKMGNVLDEYVEVLDSFGRAGRPMEGSALRAKLVALVRAGANGGSRIGSFSYWHSV